MANHNWKEGDTVWHKSGGPRMVVDDISENESGIYLQWYDNGEFKSKYFNPNSLTDKDPNSPTANPLK